jgi:hypothetical protein
VSIPFKYTRRLMLMQTTVASNHDYLENMHRQTLIHVDWKNEKAKKASHPFMVV